MMKLFGHQTRVVTYMMGNNVIVERMFRHDPGVMLYAPLRTAIYQDADARSISASTNRQPGSPASAIPASPRWDWNWTPSSPNYCNSCRCPCPPNSSATRPDELCRVSLSPEQLVGIRPDRANTDLLHLR